ncbi:hypothetical protein G1H11_14085 [Phytoactinopolyspora alkaliphila]|uniref:Uncharacterized protein n=1 Tax=Phytoactinopolyspora alkaliphila TaxID=1783498 RepID=A0A6N9YNB4_9ACTN|nr:hypothetical protein [Phytoactinopolyspora alkaliphila]NED96435.1 hypothetical protein [Phytoactinopolyspora alkaliphila]
MALTEDFDGDELPAEWTVSSPLGGETVTVSDSRVHITLPAGTSYDSIHPNGPNDNSAGIEHALLPGGGLDLAIQCDTDISNTRGLGFTAVVKSDTEADAVRCSFYASNSATNLAALVYAFLRAGGSGDAASTAGFPGANTYAHPWMRIAFDPSTGTWTGHSSPDGVNWAQQFEHVKAFTPTRIKIGLTSTNPNPGGTLRIQKVVDLLARGSTDARDPLPARNPVTLFSWDGTGAQLPAEMIDDSAGDGGAIVLQAGVDGTARFAQDMDVDGSRARIEWAGPLVTEGGVLARIRHAAAGTQAFGVVGLGIDTGNPGDQYSRGPGYIHESHGGTSRRIIRVDELDLSSVGKLGFEAPYGWLATLTDTSMVGDWWWVRVERHGRRIRMRDWLHGDPEPDTWRIDAQDQVQDGPYGVALGYAHNDGATQSGLRHLDVAELELYELAPDEEPSERDTTSWARATTVTADRAGTGERTTHTHTGPTATRPERDGTGSRHATFTARPAHARAGGGAGRAERAATTTAATAATTTGRSGAGIRHATTTARSAATNADATSHQASLPPPWRTFAIRHDERVFAITGSHP